MPEEQYVITSSRLQQYARNKSKRGTALYLSHLLWQLRHDQTFCDYTELLVATARRVAELGRLSETDERERVLSALRSHASTVDEIQEDTRLTRKRIKEILDQLTTDKLVVIKNKTNYLESGEQKVILYFLASHTR